MYEKILLAVDGSENADRATKKVIEMQQEFDCKVAIFHSLKHPKSIAINPIIFYPSFYTPLVSEEEIQSMVLKEGEKILEQKKRMFDEASMPVETHLSEDEDPEDYIERMVREEGFDLVVIGTKGIHSKLRQVILGTVATRVIKHVPCDVLIIR